MAQFQSDIELRVKVIDKELKDLERRAAKIQNTNPFSASGAGRGQTAKANREQTAALKAQRAELVLIDKAVKQQSVEQIKLLNKRTAWLKVLKEGKQISKDIAAATEKEAKAAAKLAANRKKADTAKRKQTQNNLGAGVGFPLLFGGGPGSVIGGALGSAGGFGTQILASAIGGIIDQAIADVAKLGQAFTKTGLDAEALAKAIGDISGTTQKLIEETKEVSGSQAAAEAAAKLMAAAIGDDAVTALTDLGDATNELGSATAILNTEFQALAAQLLGPVAQGVAGLIQRTNLINAADRITAEGGEGAQRLRAAAQRGGESSADPLQGAIDARLAEAAKILAERRAEATQEVRDANIENSKTLDILEAEGQILDRNKNLLDDKTLELTKGNVELKYAAKLEADGLTPLEKKVIAQERLNELKALDNKRAAQQEAADRKANSAAAKILREQQSAQRKAEQAQKREQKVLQTIAQLDIKAYDIAIKTIQATKGEVAAIKQQLSSMDALLAKRIEIINLSNKDQRIKDIEIKLAKDQVELERITLRNKQQEIALQKELNRLKAQQQIAAVQTGLDQELAGLSLGGNDQTDLLQEQANRYANTLTDINNQIEQQNLLIENTPTPDQNAINAATTQLDVLNKTKTAYETMLPKIFAAEQAQLQYNKAFAAVTPAVNSLVGGFREVIAGTKSVEEAFADFLNTIADQLAQTAAQMIAQYIALGIARAFATGGSPGGFNLSGGGSSVGSGGLPGIDSLGGLFNGSMPFIGTGTNILGRASGGPVSANTPYVVGEKGRELFVPSSSGSIVPNDALGGSTVVNITVNSNGQGSRSSSGSDTEKAAQLGRLIERSTLAIINREKRPGGALRS